jgi:2-dehydro-3-deoxygalactonokinase
MTTPHSNAALIAVDWGTTNLRAYLLSVQGKILDQRSCPGGVMSVQDRNFEAPLLSVVGEWLMQSPVPLIAAGMIGSRQGWREAPYLPCPARIDVAAKQLTAVPFQDVAGKTHQLLIGAGVQCRDDSGLHDVMRGEETQLWGSELSDGAVCILPGTHCKWAWMGRSGEIQKFRTYMTGELFALLTKHGILGRLMKPGQDIEAFKRGVLLGKNDSAHASHIIFSARTAGLMGTLAAESLSDYLSGILIGLEIGSSLKMAGALPAQINLIGDDELCMRYAQALQAVNIQAVRSQSEATAGLWKLAQSAGLVRS